MRTCGPTANPLPTAAPNIPCLMKPKGNTAKREIRDRQRKMRTILASLKSALEKMETL